MRDASGLKWSNAGTAVPKKGKQVHNEKLAKALTQKTEFTLQEFKEFNVSDLRVDNFIKSGDSYFKPDGDGHPKTVQRSHSRREIWLLAILTSFSWWGFVVAIFLGWLAEPDSAEPNVNSSNIGEADDGSDFIASSPNSLCNEHALWWSILNIVVAVPLLFLLFFTMHLPLFRLTVVKPVALFNHFNSLSFVVCNALTLDSSCTAWKVTLGMAQFFTILLWNSIDALQVDRFLRRYIGVFLLATYSVLLLSMYFMRGHRSVSYSPGPTVLEVSFLDKGFTSLFTLFMFVLKDVSLSIWSPERCTGVFQRVEKTWSNQERHDLITNRAPAVLVRSVAGADRSVSELTSAGAGA